MTHKTCIRSVDGASDVFLFRVGTFGVVLHSVFSIELLRLQLYKFMLHDVRRQVVSDAFFEKKTYFLHVQVSVG